MSPAPPAAPFIGSQQAFKWGQKRPLVRAIQITYRDPDLTKGNPQCLEETEVGRPLFCLFF